MLEKDLKITRSEYLNGKTALTDEDIINLLDLPPEKESRKDLKSYTDKNYSDFENDEASLQRLTENLINNSDYLLYRGSYIAKSKLLYEQSVTLCNEIPSLVIGQEIKESFYLLPYGYAKDNNQKLKKFADALDENAFTDIKRLYGTNIKNTYKKSKEQGKNVFYIISATDLSLSQSRGKLGFLINNDVKQGRDPSGKYYLYSENESSLIYLEVDKDGFFREERKFDLKKLRSVISNRPFSMRGQANTALTGTFNTLNDTNESVNTFFNSLLLRGEVEMIRSHKELQKYDSKYLNCLEALKQITNQTQSELLQNSNRLFIQSEIESEFYKDLIKEKKRNVALIGKNSEKDLVPGQKIAQSSTQEAMFSSPESTQFPITELNHWKNTINIKNNQIKIIKRLSKIRTEKIEPKEFLRKLKEVFGSNDFEHSTYIENQIKNKKNILRISSHSINSFYARKKIKENSIVIKLSEHDFVDHKDRLVKEYVYFPKNLTKEVKDNIINGLSDWVNTGIYTYEKADRINMTSDFEKKEKERNVALIGKITRSEYLNGKTALTDEDIINLLDLPPEKVAANIETYTEKSYKELKENPEELARLTKELTSAKYLRYKETFISKSKLLYEQSSVLYNEIPCLIVLNEMKIPAYLLPYEYAKNKQGDTRHFADSLKENAFTDFKRVFNTKIRHSFENGMEQGRDIFFLVNNEKLDKEEIKKQLEKLIKFHKGPDKQGLFLFYSEKDYKCFSFESDYSGKITENNDYELKKLRLAISDKPFTPNLERTNTNERPRSDKYNIAPTDLSVNELFYSLLKRGEITAFESDYSGKITENNDYDLKKLRLAISDKPFTPNLERTNTNERPRSSNLNISPSNMSVNELFYSLLKRGEITALASLKDLSDRENRYFEIISDMERTNNAIFSDFLKKSNTAFLLKEKQSRFYKDILKIKLQGERTMEKEKIEIQTYKFQNGETIDEILSKQTSWATDAECLDNMIDNSLREVADFADEKENELLKKISIAKNNPEVDLKLLAVQTDAAARYMAAKHYDYRLADVGNRPFSKDFINLYAQDDFPYELPSWIKNHLEEYPNQDVPEHTSEEEKAYQEWEEMLDDNQREENDSNGQQSKFDSELSDYIAGKLPKNHIFDLGFPGEILQNCGFPKEQRIELSGSHLEYKSKLKRHPFDLGEIKGLDVALQNPVAVFAYGDKTKSQNVIVNIEKESKNFLTGIHFNQKNRGYEVSDIRTLYPKENVEWLNWINQGKMIYGNKEKLQALIAQQRMNVAEVNSQVVQSPLHEHCLESVKNILQKFGDVKEIYTDGHLFYEEIREQSKIEQKFFAYYTEKGNIDARELSSLEAEEFYNALKHNDITKIDEYKNNDFHEISELADEIYLEHFKNSVSTEEKYVIESLSEIGNAIKNDSAIILKSPTFGDVTFSKGVFGDLSKKNNGGYGINHIVEGRYVKDNLSKQDIASLLYLIKNTVETTEVDKDDSKSRQNIIKDGIWVTIRKDFDGIKQNWVVTGFAENDGNGQITKEAADAIKAVNAQYGYAPEHLFVSEQVGAVIASVNTIAQNILKSNDIERIKNFKSVYANTEFLSENEKGLFIDNQSQLMSRGKQEKSLDSETTIPQNTENSINYHGLTLTKKDNNLSGLTPSGKPSVAEDISDKTHTPSTYININLEAVTNGLPDSHLKSSNLSFIQKEKNSQYYKDIIRQKERNLAQDTTKTKGEDRTMEKEKIEIQTYKFQNGETIDEILSKQTSWATDEEFLDNMIDNSLREVADFADEKENELLKKISIAKNNPEVDLKLLAVQTDAAARYMAAKHYDYRLADVGNRPFSKDFINPYAQDDFPYELPSWIKNHLEEYPNQNEPEHTSEEEKAYQEWEEMLEDNQREENIISHNVLKTKDSEKNISNTQREENSYLNSEELKSSLKKALNEIAKPLEVIPFTRENYNLLFPHSHIISPIENVKLGEHQFEKLDIKERQHILKAVHDTVATPDIIINEKRKTVFDDEKEAHVYAKAFKIDGKNKAVQSVVVSIEDENVSISTHLREINNVVNKIKMPEQLIFASTEIGQMVERLTGKQLGTVNPTRENEIFAPPVTTILQNTENSINYHGLTLTKKDNNLIEPAYDVLLISGIDDKTDSKLIEMLDNTAKWDQYCVLNKSENYIPAIAAEIVEKEKEIKNENVNKSFIQKVQDLKAKVSKSLKKNVAVGVALTSVLSANPNLFAQEKPVKLPSEQTILKEAAKEKENLLKIYKDKSPEELLKLLLEANEEKTAAKIQASNLENTVKELEVKNTKLENTVKELEVKNTKLEFYKEHYKTKSATQESFYDEMKKTQDMYESLKRSSQQDHDILYKHAKIVVNGQERVCHTGLVDGFKNCVTRLDKSLKLNKELVKENNELRKIINQSNQNERNGVSY